MAVPSDEAVFKALADPTRRAILDGLYERNGQTLRELESRLRDVPVRGDEAPACARSRQPRDGAPRRAHEAALPESGPDPRAAGALDRQVRPGGVHVPTRPAGRSRERSTHGSDRDRPCRSRGRGDEAVAGLRDLHPRDPRAGLGGDHQLEYTLKYYFSSAVESDLKPGSPIVYAIDGEPAILGEVLESDPPTKLVCTFDARWDDDVRPDAPSTISWLIEPAGPGVSKVTVVHDGFAGETATSNQVGGGMPFILSGLKTLLETGEPLMPTDD